MSLGRGVWLGRGVGVSGQSLISSLHGVVVGCGFAAGRLVAAGRAGAGTGAGAGRKLETVCWVTGVAVGVDTGVAVTAGIRGDGVSTRLNGSGVNSGAFDRPGKTTANVAAMAPPRTAASRVTITRLGISGTDKRVRADEGTRLRSRRTAVGWRRRWDLNPRSP